MSAVGFDLDMTLVDTRPGIGMALRKLAADTGRPIDVDAVVSSLGPPVAEALSPWFETEELPAAVQTFRRHMAEVGVVNVDPLPGASAALDTVRAAGHEIIVVTSKIEPLALATLAHAGLRADLVFGDLWAEGKAAPLRARGALCYVGDHPADMRAARAAEIPGFAVTSGASSRDELLAAGATEVATSLAEFPAWFVGRGVSRPL